MTTLGPYSLIRCLGTGGMGEVWLASDPRLARNVALKLLASHIEEDAELRQRFLREARAVAALNHPNITTIHEVGEAEGRHYIAFEYIDGQTLAEIMAERRLSPTEVLEFASSIAGALEHAHGQGIVHRDLKPGNVMVTQRKLVKVLDFGLAKVFGSSPARAGSGDDLSLTRSHAVFGTPRAMSPEQALGREVDPRSDIFSLGSLIYEMASGRSPFVRETAMETIDAVIHAEPPALAGLQPDVAPGLAALVERAMQKDPHERYSTMAELIADLQRTTAGRRTRRVRGPRPVGVMYFENLGDPSDSDRVGAMLAHLVTTDLASGGELRMVSQQRLFESARQAGQVDGRITREVASNVAERAGVGTMLLGHVARTGARTVATISLVDRESGQTLGSCKTNGTATPDVFAMAEALAAAVRKTLTTSGHARKRAARPSEADSLRDRLTRSVDAYRAYVRGMEHMQRTHWNEAAETFGVAVGIDPAFAVAYFWQALAYAWASDGDKAKRAIQRAGAFREKLTPEMQRVLGGAELFVHDQLDEALPVLREIVHDDPDSRDALYMLGEVYLHSATQADAREAARIFRRGLDRNPDFPFFHRHLVDSLMLANRIDDARAVVASWTSADVRSQAQCQSRAEAYGRRLDLALELLESTQPDNLLRIVAVLLLSDRPRDPRVAELMASIAKQQPSWASRPPGRFAIYVAEAVVLAVGCGAFSLAQQLLLQVSPAEAARGASGLAGNCVVHATVYRALLEDLRGNQDAAAKLMEEAVTAHPFSPRVRYLAAVLAGRRQDRAGIAAQVDVLDDVAGRGWGPMCAHYRDAARAELALAESRPDVAASLCEAVVASGNLCLDDLAYVHSAAPFIRDAAARARLAAGDTSGAIEAWQALVASGIEWAGYPMVRLLALHRLGMLQLEQGQVSEGHAMLHRVLDYWGSADWELPQVLDSRARLSTRSLP